MMRRFTLLVMMGAFALGWSTAALAQDEAPDDLMDMLKDDAILGDEGAAPVPNETAPVAPAPSAAPVEPAAGGAPDGAPDAAPPPVDGAQPGPQAGAPSEAANPDADGAGPEGAAADGASADGTAADPNAPATGAPKVALGESEAEGPTVSFWPNTWGTGAWVGGTIFAAFIAVIASPAIAAFVALNFFAPNVEVGVSGGAVRLPTTLLVLLVYLFTVVLPLPAVLATVVTAANVGGNAAKGRTMGALLGLAGICAGCCVGGVGSSLVLLGAGMAAEAGNFDTARVTSLGQTESLYLEPRSAVIGGATALVGGAFSLLVPTAAALTSSGAAWLYGPEASEETRLSDEGDDDDGPSAPEAQSF